MSNQSPNFANAQQGSNGDNIVKKAGVYAIFLNSLDEVPECWHNALKREDKILYSGHGKSLYKRFKQHFCYQSVIIYIKMVCWCNAKRSARLRPMFKKQKSQPFPL